MTTDKEKNLYGLSEEFLEQFHPTKRRWVYKNCDGSISVPGGFSCPWCGSEGMEIIDEPMSVICSANPKHRYFWTPWGG